jgi:hypothetical protein
MNNKKLFFMEQDNKSEIPRLPKTYSNIGVHINHSAFRILYIFLESEVEYFHINHDSFNL